MSSTKYIAVQARLTEDIWGFGTIMLPADESTLNEINRLRETFAKVKAIDNGINNFTLYSHNLNLEVTNSDFEIEQDVDAVNMADEFYELVTTEYETDFKVESPFIRVSEHGITMVFCSKWTSDEVWSDIAYEQFEEFYKKSLEL